MNDNFKRFMEIRKAYSRILPEWESHYLDTGRMFHDPYFMDWIPYFTPIETSVWGDIRSSGMPFYPQIPVLKFFLDFGCPMLRIGIECDGKAWHNSELDKVRDAQLADAGWSIFRIEGHECKRTIESPYYREDEDCSDGDIEKWFMSTSEGIMHAINARYFKDQLSAFDIENSVLIDATLCEHNTTPYVHIPSRRKITPSHPVSLSEALAGYVQKLQNTALKVRA